MIGVDALDRETLAALARCDAARIRGYLRDVAAAWDRLHPGKPLPVDPHACIAAVYGDTTEASRIHRRTIRRCGLHARIILRILKKAGAL